MTDLSAAQLVAVEPLVPYAANARTHSEAQIEQIKDSIRAFGFVGVLAFDEQGLAIGHGRRQALLEMWEAGEQVMGPGKREPLPDGMAPAIDITGLSDAERRALIIADNKLALNAGWDEEILARELAALSEIGFEMPVIGFDAKELERLLNPPEDDGQGGPKLGTMAAEFLIPPFSVLNAREGWWQDRKRQWIALGIESEVGRGENLIKRSLHERLSMVVPGQYQAASDFIAKGRADNLDDDAIWQLAVDTYGAPKQFDAIPGGAGKNAAYRKGGAKIDGSNRLPAGAALSQSMADGAGTKRKGGGRTFGQDMLDGEGSLKLQKGVRRSTGFDPDETQPGQPRSAAMSVDTRATKTQDWVAGKIADGDIAGGMSSGQTGTSIFDPVLCELAYRWFSPVGGVVLDPFAGGSVRGIVCAALGRRYCGVDLRPEQIEANEAQWPGVAARLLAGEQTDDLIDPEWHVGDSATVIPALDVEPDMIFSCPPYGDLEVYSDDPADISTLDQAGFDAAYAGIIGAAVAKLKPDRFACFVVGDYRDKKGIYANFVSKTIAAFEAAGAMLYNEAILVTSVGSLPIRAAKQFRTTRKLGKTHQNILVFVKGDPRKATAACGPVDVSAALADIEPDDEPTIKPSSPALKPASASEVKISAAMARLMFIQCGPDCIATGCGGNCCDAPSRPTGCMITVNPDEQAAIEALGGSVVDGLLQPRPGERGCPFKTDGLCDLHATGQKPWGCVASPFTLNPSGTLIVRNRYRLLPCYRNEGAKEPAYRAFRSSLAIIFGEPETDRIVAHLDAGGGDMIAQIDPAIRAKLVENDEIKKRNKIGGEV